MKKIVAVFMAFVLFIASADMVRAGDRLISENNVYGDFTYSVHAVGDCSISICARLDSYNGQAEHLVIPGALKLEDGYIGVSGIPSQYRYPEKIKQITMSNYVWYRGQFAGLPNLESVHYYRPDRDAYTKDGVLFDSFSGRLWLRVYPRGKKGESYQMPKKVESLGPYAFANCKNLSSVTLPKNLTEIYEYAFRGCTSLKKITLPKKVNYIGSGAFKECSARVKMPANMKKVKDNSEEGFHYELFVKCRPKKKPGAAIMKKLFRDIDRISPATKKVTIKKKKKHKLVTHFQIKKKWYTLYSDCLRYTSSNPKVATVSDKGVVKAKKKGTAKITVTHSWLYDYNYYVAGKYTVKVKVK